jgi:hypothetical protein
MNITKKVKLIQKLAKEVGGEIEDNTNYFLMHNRKYYLKKGKLYTSTQYGKPVGNITMKGDIELSKRSKRTKSRKISGVNNTGSRTSNNLSRRINLNKNKNNKNKNTVTPPEEEDSTSVTDLKSENVMHETEQESELPPAPINEQETVSRPSEEASEEVEEPSMEEKTELPEPVEESSEEKIQEETSSEEEKSESP